MNIEYSALISKNYFKNKSDDCLVAAIAAETTAIGKTDDNYLFCVYTIKFFKVFKSNECINCIAVGSSPIKLEYDYNVVVCIEICLVFSKSNIAVEKNI